MDINNMELLNDSGLSSLSGFSYQIKVFILRLTQLQQGQRVEFETLDDVAVRSLSSKDSISDSCFKWKVDETSSIEVFQVKQTNVSESVRRQVLYNWLLAYNQKPDISKFTLYVAQGYSINEKAFTNDPLIPFLVIDHISKPFDDKNQKALGAILHGAYTNLQKSEMQIILFDDEDASSLGLTPDHSINLLGEDKSGFNPFYMPSKEDSPNAPEEVE